MTVPLIVGVVVGVVAAATGLFRAVSGANPYATMDNLLPTAIVFGLLWGGVAFGVALLITRLA